jgi:hypothetical protein
LPCYVFTAERKEEIAFFFNEDDKTNTEMGVNENKTNY